MLEVLVSLVLIAITLLGQAGLQASALKLNKGATLRMQAVLLADELAERIENNKTAAIAGSYVVANSSTPAAVGTNCLTNFCTPTELATYDLAVWQAGIVARLPVSSWTVTHAVTGNPSTYSIVITWQDRRDNVDRVSYATAGTSETLALTTTKVISQ